MILPPIVSRAIPALPLAISSLFLFIIIIGLGVDIWTLVDCTGYEVEFGWKKAHSNGFKYSSCNFDDCDTLDSSGKAALAFSILTVFLLVGIIALSFLVTFRGQEQYRKINMGLLCAVCLTLLISFASWTSNGHDVLDDLYGAACSVKLGDTTNIMIAAFVFMVIVTFIEFFRNFRGAASAAAASV